MVDPPRPLGRTWALAGALVALLVACGSAAAAPRPALYFLGDAYPGPVVDGHLLPPDPGLVPNVTSPQVRPVFPVASGVAPVRFATLPGASHATRVKGFLYVGLWTGASPTVHGNLSATVSELTADGKVIRLASASVAVDANASKLPEPTSLVPKDPPDPTDPEGWVTSVVMQEAALILPVILQPPTLLNLGFVDRTVNDTSRLVVDFTLEPAPGGPVPGMPVPIGAAATVQYNYTLNPSFLYVPWYEPDPPRPTSAAPRPTSPQAPHPTAPSPAMPPPPSENRKLPGVEPALVVAGLAGLACVARRRAE